MLRRSAPKNESGPKEWEMKKFLSLLLVLGTILVWGSELKAETKPSLAILPFFVERIENPARGAVLCPLCGSIYRYGEVVPGSPYALTRLLYAKIEAFEKFKILSLEKVEGVLPPSMKKQFEEKPLPSAIQIGKELNVDFILVGYLFRFEERIGSRIGVTKPASVGFDVHLLRVRDGKRVWDGKFDETQQALSENLLKIGSFVRRKASWLTAEELSSVGMDEMLKRLPGPKELEEMP
jgi:TolB-like protein